MWLVSLGADGAPDGPIDDFSHVALKHERYMVGGGGKLLSLVLYIRSPYLIFLVL